MRISSYTFLRLAAIVLLSGFLAPTLLRAGWEKVSGPFIARVHAMASHGSTLIASVGSTTYRSTDNGGPWTEVRHGGHIPICAADNGIYMGSYQGIQVSHDDGQTWTYKANNDLGVTTAITVYNSKLYIASEDQGVCVSSDDGQTWTPLNNGLPGKNLGGFLVANSRLYLSVGNNLDESPTTPFYGGVFYLDGDTWHDAAVPNVDKTFALASKDSIIVVAHNANIAFSTDNGSTWKALTLDHPYESLTINTLAVYGAIIYAGTDRGLWVSDDVITWTRRENISCEITAFTAVNGLLIAGTADIGIMASHNNGINWDAMNDGLFSAPAVSALTKGKGNNVLAALRTSPRVYNFSATSGALGTLSSPIPDLSNATAIVQVGQRIVALSGGDIYGVPKRKYLYTSDDNGLTWQSVGNMLINKLHSLGTIDDTTLVVGYSTFNGITQGVMVSDDKGASWHTFELPSQAYTVVQHNKSWLFVGVAGGVFQSVNSGVTWNRASLDFAADDTITFLASNDTTMFAVASNGRIYRCTDNGAKWEYFDKVTGKFDPIVALVASDKFLFAGTKSGVFMTSINDGTTWERVNSDGAGYECAALTMANDHLYAALGWTGVWRKPLAEFTTPVSVPEHTTSIFSLSPNPLVSSSVLTLCDGCSVRNATLTLTDMAGKIASNQQGIFGNSVVIQRQNLAAGLYNFRLVEAGTIIASGTIVVQ